MSPLTGLDGLFLSLDTPATPMHIGALHLVDLPASYRGDFCARVRDAMAARLHVAPVFYRRLAPMPLGFANPVWVEAAPDLDFHVRCVSVAAPGDERALQARVASLHQEPLDRERPLWMLYVFDGLEGIAPARPGGRVRAIYLKGHHAALDGEAGAALGEMLFDRSARGSSRGVRRPVRCHVAALPSRRSLVRSAISHSARQAVQLAPRLPKIAATLARMLFTPRGEMATTTRSRFGLGPRTVLNRSITGERSYAAASVPLEQVRAIGAATGTTVNDVVLALCSDTLRRYLHRHDQLPRQSLIATVPISLRELGDAEFTTRATLSLVDLATDVADPLRRLWQIHASAHATKSLVRGKDSLVPTDFPSIGVPWLLTAAARLYGASRVTDAVTPIANVIVSNISGPRQALYFAGGRLRTYWPLSAVEHGLGLNVTVISYAGALEFGFTAAACAVPDASELVTELAAALAQLEHRKPARVGQHHDRRKPRSLTTRRVSA